MILPPPKKRMRMVGTAPPPTHYRLGACRAIFLPGQVQDYWTEMSKTIALSQSMTSAPIGTTEENMDKDKFWEFFQESNTNNNFSATRLAFLAWIFSVLIVWVVQSFRHDQIEQIPDSVIVIIGTLMTGKVVQKFGEK